MKYNYEVKFEWFLERDDVSFLDHDVCFAVIIRQHFLLEFRSYFVASTLWQWFPAQPCCRQFMIDEVLSSRVSSLVIGLIWPLLLLRLNAGAFHSSSIIYIVRMNQVNTHIKRHDKLCATKYLKTTTLAGCRLAVLVLSHTQKVGKAVNYFAPPDGLRPEI